MAHWSILALPEKRIVMLNKLRVTLPGILALTLLLPSTAALAFPTAEQAAAGLLDSYTLARLSGDDQIAYQAARSFAEAVAEPHNYFREDLSLIELGRFADAAEALESYAQIRAENMIELRANDEAFLSLIQGRTLMLQGKLAEAQAAFQQSAARFAAADPSDWPGNLAIEMGTENQIWLDYSARLIAQGAALPGCAQDAATRQLLAAQDLMPCLNPELPAPVIRRALNSLGAKRGLSSAQLQPWLDRHETAIAAMSALAPIATAADLDKLLALTQGQDPITQLYAVTVLGQTLERLGPAVTKAQRQQFGRQLTPRLLAPATPLQVRMALVPLLGTLGDTAARPALNTLRGHALTLSKRGKAPLFPDMGESEAYELSAQLLPQIDQALKKLK